MKKILYIINLFFLFSCSVKYHYKDPTNVTSNDLQIQQMYKSLTKDTGYNKNNNQILLVFSTISFANSYISINNKDTIKIDKLKSDDCASMKLYLIDKKIKDFYLETDGMPKVKIKILKKYDYIKIDRLYKKKWDITYSSYFPYIPCY